MFHKAVLFVMLFAFVSILSSQPTSPESSQPVVFLVVYRTAAHVRSSKPEVFHGFASDLAAFLKQSNVSVKADPERGTIETESPMSVENMSNIARQVGATSLLFVIVDRPVTKWIKVTVQSYDIDGKLIWSEEASDGGSMSGKSGYKKTLERIQASLTKRLGTPGLPVDANKGNQTRPTSEGAGR